MSSDAESSDGERSPDTDEQYCSSCGEIIKEAAEICPECGVRQSESESQSDSSHGLVFSIIDSWKYQRPLRHLANIILVFVSAGTYLGVLLVEGLIHYRNLNNGDSEPYDEDKAKVWSTFSHVE